MRKEIGSEFWDIPVCKQPNNVFPKNTVWYLSGRSALLAIIKDIKRKIDFKSVALPSWCCESMIIPFLKEEIKVKFYSVYLDNGALKKDYSDISDCDAILLIDFFGFKQESSLDFKGIIINDITHSVFCGKFMDADYTFGSLRKWAGFYTGGFAFSKTGTLQTEDVCPQYIELRKDAMNSKALYISGETDSKEYLKGFAVAEEILENYPFCSADNGDILNARYLDIEYIRKKRRENAAVLLKGLYKITVFNEIKENDCPLFVPIFVPKEKRDKLRTYLIENKVYCPIHWPVSEFHNLNSKTNEIYEREISVICDQRYEISDMEYMCQLINDFLNRG